MERAGLVRDGSESSQDQIAGGQQLDLSRVGTEQIGWIMSSADDVYIDYNDGYYLYNRRYPGVGLALTVVM